jgi:hypothetical protein
LLGESLVKGVYEVVEDTSEYWREMLERGDVVVERAAWEI